MYLKQLKITNYKSFFETSEFNFEPGFNVLLGANSSGKTSVLEAIVFHEFQNIPHRSLLNVGDVDSTPFGCSKVALAFSMGYSEIRKLFENEPAFWLPIGIDTEVTRPHSDDLTLLKSKFETAN